MKRNPLFVLLLLTIVAASAACARSPTPAAPTLEPQAIPTSTPSPEGPEGTPAMKPVRYTIEKPKPVAFALYEPEPVSTDASVPVYTLDLNAVANRDLIAQLTPAQQTHLTQNGFVVLPSGAEQIYQIYKSAKDRGMPILVTADAMLHTHHVLYDYALRLAEIQRFVTDLRDLNTVMLSTAQEQYANAIEPVKEAARRNVAFFAVASVLLEPETPVPQ